MPQQDLATSLRDNINLIDLCEQEALRVLYLHGHLKTYADSRIIADEISSFYQSKKREVVRKMVEELHPQFIQEITKLSKNFPEDIY